MASPDLRLLILLVICLALEMKLRTIINIKLDKTWEIHQNI